MNNYRASLRVVGIVLIIVGFLDIGLMIYCIVNDMGYSSSFNIFAVIAGILLFRGGLRTANNVAFFSAFILSGAIGMLFTLLLILPFDFVLANLKIYPASIGGSLLLAVCLLVLLIWIYHRLTAPLIRAAIVEKHPRYASFWRRPSTGFLFGTILVIALAGSLGFLSHGADTQRARAEAKLKVGDGYKFWVTSLSTQSAAGHTHVEAIVSAYNQKEIKEVAVEWEE
jgi:hypothetical protein